MSNIKKIAFAAACMSFSIAAIAQENTSSWFPFQAEEDFSPSVILDHVGKQTGKSFPFHKKPISLDGTKYRTLLLRNKIELK